MPLIDDIVNIDKPDDIFWLTFAVDEFSGLSLHPSNISFKYSGSA